MCVARKDAGGVHTRLRMKLMLPPPYDQVLHQLKEAWTYVAKAENAAMACDGAVPPTRTLISDGDFDVMARHVQRAIKTLERGNTRESYAEMMRQVQSWMTAPRNAQESFLRCMKTRQYGKDALYQAWESFLEGWRARD